MDGGISITFNIQKQRKPPSGQWPVGKSTHRVNPRGDDHVLDHAAVVEGLVLVAAVDSVRECRDGRGADEGQEEAGVRQCRSAFDATCHASS